METVTWGAASRRWMPLLVAALALLAACGVASGTAQRGGDDVREPTTSGDWVDIPTEAPEVPYVVGRRLFVGGQQVVGGWFLVESGPQGWLGWRSDQTFSYGVGVQASSSIEGLADVPPVISPNGLYVGQLLESGRLTGLSTDPSGPAFGSVEIDLGDRQDGTQVSVRAVTDDGAVIAQGAEVSVLWRPLAPDGELVDLTETAPDQYVVRNTPAGLVVTDGLDGAPYLAEISDKGEFTSLGSLPAHDRIRISPEGNWLVYTPLGTSGGEVDRADTLEVATLDATDGYTLPAPAGWSFGIASWVWEDDDLLVATVLSAGGDQRERMARCSVGQRRCVLTDTP